MGREIYHVDWEPKKALEGMNQLAPWEELAYRRILDFIYATGNALEDDDRKMGWITKTGARWPRIKKVLLAKGKIFIEDGRIKNETCERKFAGIDERIAQKSRAGKVSAQRRKALKAKESPPTAVDPAVGPDAGEKARPAPTAEPRIHESRKKERGPLHGPVSPSSQSGDTAGALWQRALAALRARLDGKDFAWIEPLRLAAVDGAVAVIRAPSRMIADQAGGAADAILGALAEAGAEVEAVRFETGIAAGRAA